MTLVEYTDDEGLVYVVEVPPNTDSTFYRMAPHIGPPDLSEMDASQAVIREIHNALAHCKLLTAPDLNKQGAKARVLDIIQRWTGEKGEDARTLLRQLVYLYQREYYPENFEGDKDS